MFYEEGRRSCTFTGHRPDRLDASEKKVIKNADKIHYVSNHPGRTAFFKRNEWMVDRASRLIAVFTGAPGGTKKTIEYAKMKEIEIIRWGEEE